MQKYIRTIDFSDKWKEVYKIIKSIGKDLNSNSIDKYSYSLYDRALYIFDAHVAIEQTNNTSVSNILLRSLYEIKVKASKYQDDRNLEIKNTNSQIKNEIERFLKKIEKGQSFTSQTLWKHLKDKKFKFQVNSEGLEYKRKTIKKNFEEADLGFDYDILYWLTSLFIHTNPLSLVIEHKEQYPPSEIFEILSTISRDMDMINIQVLGTLLWITEYLFEEILSKETNDMIDNLWTSIRELISKKYDIEWKVDPNLETGTMKAVTNNGKEMILKRKQRK